MGERAGAVLGNPESSDLNRQTTETLRHGGEEKIQDLGLEKWNVGSWVLSLMSQVSCLLCVSVVLSKGGKEWIYTMSLASGRL